MTHTFMINLECGVLHQVILLKLWIIVSNSSLGFVVLHLPAFNVFKTSDCSDLIFFVVFFCCACACVCVLGSLQVRYNLGGLRAPFTIDADQRNLANGQPHSFNMSRVDRRVTIQVREDTLLWTGALFLFRPPALFELPRHARLPQVLLPHKAGQAVAQ